MENRLKQRKKFLICFITGLISGILIGAAVLNILLSYRMDGYYREVRKLEALLEEKDTKLEKLDKKLEDSINRNRYLLTNVEVVLNLDEAEDEISRLTIEKGIKEKYSYLLGQEIKSIDINLAAEVIDERIFLVGGKEYKLKVSRATLTEVFTVWVNVELLQKQDSSVKLE